LAVSYGADAVYCAGQEYGLRAAAENLTNIELERGVSFAHKHGAKVFVTLNALLHNDDMEGLGEFCSFLESIGADAVIVADLGVIDVVQEFSTLPIHLSTQASCLNTSSALLWKSQGVKRVVVARELTIAETSRIREQADIEVEMFIHGAMCMAYSGKCTISNFTAGRDSNRGGCIQSCRFSYGHTPLPSSKSSKKLPIIAPGVEGTPGARHFMSSKDLQGLDLLPEFISHNIDSLKIEGRMKSPFYVASIVRSYRRAIDALLEGRSFDPLSTEIDAAPHREYCSGSLKTPASSESIYSQGGGSQERASHQYLGLVLAKEDDLVAIRLHAPVTCGETIEFLLFDGSVLPLTISKMQEVNGNALEKAHQDSVVCLAVDENSGVSAGNVVRIKPLSQQEAA
ncbi:MAG: U32 family peptidase C-terminal domain-containing protein, partial [Bdellovibrionales bacterium]|nr:U32 family peptidase C-terminal domain-containing protein [Bdellovibrionales bacterium]